MALTGRVAAFLARLEWRGILTGMRPSKVARSGSGWLVHLELRTADTDRPGLTWTTTVMARLPDSEADPAWARRILLAFADALGHELGEAVWLDGAPVASIHTKPLIWPWRVIDREES